MDHCWHSDNYVLASHPPQYPHTCCKCGEKYTQRVVMISPSSDHGPFVRMPERYRPDPLPKGPCVPREE
jgi:hypothetical protein